MSGDARFIDRVLRGEVSVSAIDDFVDAWHDSDSPLTLREYLGLTEAEYETWLKTPDRLDTILAARRAAE
ncbi:hypothetical protein [Caenispirillum salinarum]|uniref:hypothetical protein n=1 Tax=Caenispirillum salinarum TaxID=859058 RepID=UPI0038503B2D